MLLWNIGQLLFDVIIIRDDDQQIKNIKRKKLVNMQQDSFSWKNNNYNDYLVDDHCQL